MAKVPSQGKAQEAVFMALLTAGVLVVIKLLLDHHGYQHIRERM